jgi:membrane peptidoglycan carboxypeptidase
MAKAAYKNLEAHQTREGASTITQQLIKNTHLTSEKTMQRKIREVALAHKLEKKYSKDEILQMYLDAVYYGNGLNGLFAAANFYYAKSPNELTIREAAGLSGLLRSPARYNPITNFENFNGRTNLVLKLMYEQGRISKDEYETARTEETKIHGKHVKKSADTYVALATAEAAKITARNDIKVYTFYADLVQKAVENAVKTPDFMVKSVQKTPADCMILAANPDGEITAVYTNNRLLPTARRNFGSILKPLCVYAPAIETNSVQSETMINDEPYLAGDFHPKNHDGVYHGEVTVKNALAQSYNIPAVKILEYTTLPRAVMVGKRLGLALGEENLNLALGVTENGTSAYEVIGGFCALCNGGRNVTPSLISKITTNDGEILWEFAKSAAQAIKPETAITVTDMLKTAVREGTAKKLSSLDFDIAAKTGSTQRANTENNTDAAVVSYTPEGVLFVWHGNASMKPENDLPAGATGGGITSYIAREIWRDIHKGDRKFEKPAENKNIGVAAPLKIETINLSGRVGETGAPALKFNTKKGKKYEIHRNIGGTKSVLAVVSGNNEQYNFIDTAAAQNKVIEYTVKCGETESNTIKIYVADPINNSATPQKHGKSKHWFF